MKASALSVAAMRATAAVAFGAAILLSGVPDGRGGMASARAADIIVDIDEASIHRLMRKAATIVVGNPSIADVNVQGDTLLLVMGKSPGHTNVIALDRAGMEIENVAVHVRNAGTRRVTLHRGSDRVSFNCAPVCDRALVVGDAELPFESLQKQTTIKSQISQGSTDAATGGGQ